MNAMFIHWVFAFFMKTSANLPYVFLLIGLSFNKIIFNVNCSQPVNERRLDLVQSLNKMCSLTGILYLDLIVFNKIN
jgi:hypothetical protein